MTAKNVTYYSPVGRKMYGGKTAPNVVGSGFTFDSVTALTTGTTDPTNMSLVLQLHGSGGQNYTTGKRFEAMCSGPLAYGTYNKFLFSSAFLQTGVYCVRPIDAGPAGGQSLQSNWLGYYMMPDAVVRLITEHKLDALMDWVIVNIPHLAKKQYLQGGSMGAWGTITYGLRRPHYFAAIYPDRPRWRYASPGKVAIVNFTDSTGTQVNVATAPFLAPEDGGVRFSDYVNMIAYVSDTTKKIPWVGWCIGRGDGYSPFDDHIDAVAAMRAAKRGFAFAWNNGDHSGGSIPSEIFKSYPYGLFELSKGYPLFTEHSLDQDPSVDLVGGINIGLSFKNVIETVNGWSCQVTSVVGPCTVKVEPISDIFKAAVTPQLATIPAANSWVTVSFTA